MFRICTLYNMKSGNHQHNVFLYRVGLHETHCSWYFVGNQSNIDIFLVTPFLTSITDFPDRGNSIRFKISFRLLGTVIVSHFTSCPMFSTGLQVLFFVSSSFLRLQWVIWNFAWENSLRNFVHFLFFPLSLWTLDELSRSIHFGVVHYHRQASTQTQIVAGFVFDTLVHEHICSDCIYQAFLNHGANGPVFRW